MDQWPRPRRPSEPEIIPPGAPEPPPAGLWTVRQGYGYRRVEIRTPGPLGLVLLGMAAGAVLLVIVLLLLGAVLLWLPLLAIGVAVAILSALFRSPSQRPY